MLMMISLAIVSSAAFGTVVEAQKVSAQPNLKVIDSSWGDPVATNVTSKTENTYLWHFWSLWADSNQDAKEAQGRTAFEPEDEPFDIYMCYDDQYFYFGIIATDFDIRGHGQGHHGDGIQMYFAPADAVKDPTIGIVNNRSHFIDNVYCWTLDFDDWTTGMRIYAPEDGHPGDPTNAQMIVAQGHPSPIVNADPDEVGENCFHAIIAIPWENYFPKKSAIKEYVVDGAEFAIAFMRVSATSNTITSPSGTLWDDDGYSGGLCWGKYLMKNTLQYADPTNESLNTVILRDPATATSTDPEDTTTEIDPPATADLSGVSSWALTEVEAAINEGLVPEYIQKDWTSPITRGQVSEMFIRLLEKATGKTVDAIIAEKGAAIEEGKFEDTNDANVYAANALGIINGTSSSKFSPDGTLKRAQIAALINRVAKVVGVNTEGYTHGFEDITDNYSWVNAELGWPSSVGIINGVSSTKFNPDGALTTEQAILITYRALGVLKAQ